MIYDGFERPTEYYNERLKEIDEKICKLIHQRKIVSDRPGFPTEGLIATWAKKFDFYEDFLNGLFGHILAEEHFQPQIIPQGFVKSIPVLSSFQKDELFYALTSIRQYENASVVNLSVDHDTYDVEEAHLAHTMIGHDLKLKVVDAIGTKYNCQNRGGGGFDGHTAFQFLIAPPLPEDLKGVTFKFSNGEGQQDFIVLEF